MKSVLDFLFLLNYQSSTVFEFNVSLPKMHICPPALLCVFVNLLCYKQKRTIMYWIKKVRFIFLLNVLVLAGFESIIADPPSHDPTKVVKEGDTYYVFTTGDGIWNFSSTDSLFATYNVEDPVFPIGT